MYDEILAPYSHEEILQICKYLNKNYNIYDPNDVRWKQIKYAFYKTSEMELSEIQKDTISNGFINYLFLNYYTCERMVKYYFINYLRDAQHDIVAFEMSIGDSRIDICRINGELCAYEIKTEYDNYDRLSSQMSDYIKAFEKVYVIIPQSRAHDIIEHIPSECGIISYGVNNQAKMSFSYRRAASKNICDINILLKSASSSDLSRILKLLRLKPQNTKNAMIEQLQTCCSNKKFLCIYKKFLKEKYKTQWEYLKDNFDKILPIDCQSFFSSQMDPKLLYEIK